MPKVSLILSAYNAAGTLGETLSSLSTSTLDDWEAVIVNDASQDATGDILEEFSRKEHRVRLLHNDINLGLAASLNRAINASQSPYLARLDADDIQLPQRLKRQTTFLDAHSNVGILGMGAYTIDGTGRPLGYKPPVPTVAISWAKLWRVAFIHPTVMMRRKLLDEHDFRYNEDFSLAQDFELWSRILNVTQGANLSQPGIRYRVHAGQATKAKINHRLDLHRQVSRMMLSSIIQTPIKDNMLEAQRAYFLGEAARGEAVPDLHEALIWREAVAEKAFLSTGCMSSKLGLGLDLWHLLRNRKYDRENVNVKSRSRNLLKSGPVLLKHRLQYQFWKLKGNLGKITIRHT